MGVGMGACDLCGPEQRMVLVEGGREAVDAVNPGLVLGGPAGGGAGALGLSSPSAITVFSSSGEGFSSLSDS